METDDRVMHTEVELESKVQVGFEDSGKAMKGQGSNKAPSKEVSSLLFNTCCTCLIVLIVMILCIITMTSVEDQKLLEPTL